MLILRGHGGAKLLFSSSTFRYLSHFSTSTPSNPIKKTLFMVDYLINSLNFSPKEAISISTKVTRLKSPKTSTFAIHSLKDYGLDDTQIRDLVSFAPNFILGRYGKTLAPKLGVFKELGLPGSDLVKLIKRNPYVFTKGLNTYINPAVNYIRKLLGSDEKVIKAIKRSSWFLTNNRFDQMPANVLFLQKIGLSNERIGKIIIQNPRLIVQKLEWLQDIVKRVEGEFGLSPDSAMFVHGVCMASSNNRSNIEKKFVIFRSFGWADSEIYTMARSQPSALRLSKDKVRKGLNFFMNELGYTPAYLMSHPCFLMFSLEKRVKPRHRVLTLLDKYKLINSRASFYTITLVTELEFLNKYVLRYKDDVPNLYETYIGSLKQ